MLAPRIRKDSLLLLDHTELDVQRRNLDENTEERATSSSGQLSFNTVPAIPHTPASSDDMLRLKTAHHLDWLRLRESWFKYIPSQLGQSHALDLAVETFNNANRFAIEAGVVTIDSCFRSYAKAIVHLREAMSTPGVALSDHCLLACALLVRMWTSRATLREPDTFPSTT